MFVRRGPARLMLQTTGLHLWQIDVRHIVQPTPEAVPASGVETLNGRNVTFSSTSHILLSNMHRSTQHSVRTL
jgi:hypothetical protein